jgi:hypothetical protein
LRLAECPLYEYIEYEEKGKENRGQTRGTRLIRVFAWTVLLPRQRGGSGGPAEIADRGPEPGREPAGSRVHGVRPRPPRPLIGP